MLVESLLGGIGGGLLRLAPELLKFFDRKAEREHEARMMGLEIQAAEKKLEYGFRTAELTVDMKHLDAIAEANKSQASMARSGGKIVSAISALVRPVVTYWFVALYSIMKIALLVLAWNSTQDWKAVFTETWGEQDWAIFSMILVFWFVGRVHERDRGG